MKISDVNAWMSKHPWSAGALGMGAVLVALVVGISTKHLVTALLIQTVAVNIVMFLVRMADPPERSNFGRRTSGDT